MIDSSIQPHFSVVVQTLADFSSIQDGCLIEVRDKRDESEGERFRVLTPSGNKLYFGDRKISTTVRQAKEMTLQQKEFYEGHWEDIDGVRTHVQGKWVKV